MVHGLTNDAVGISGVAVIERALTPDAQPTRAIPTLALALILVIAGWPEQGFRGSPRSASADGERPPGASPKPVYLGGTRTG